MNKQSLRQINRQQLQALSPQEKAAYDRAVIDRFFDLLERLTGDVVSVYNPMPFEVDVLPLIERLYDLGKRVCFPAKLNMTHQKLVFKEMTRDEFRASAKTDIFVQGFNYPIVDPDILVIPFVGFHPFGYRLGYGGGYYDTALYALRQQKPVTAIGIGYSSLEINQPFFESHDEKFDYIITEKQVLKIT